MILVRFARSCTGVLEFHSKNLQITSKLLTLVTDITSFETHLESFSSELLCKFGQNRLGNMFLYDSLSLSLSVFYGD